MFNGDWGSATKIGLGLAGGAFAVLLGMALLANSEHVGCKKPYNNPRYAAPNPDLPPYSPAPGVRQRSRRQSIRRYAAIDPLAKRITSFASHGVRHRPQRKRPV